MAKLRILIIDDEEDIRHGLTIRLKKEGYEVRAVGDGEEGLKELLAGREDGGGTRYDLVLCDLRMPKMDGMALLAEIGRRGLRATVIVMSAFGSRERAIEAIKAGAYDYIDKPFGKDEILLTIQKAEERLQLKEENERLRAVASRQGPFRGIIGSSEAMHRVIEMVGKVAAYDSTVLLSGESGTGKELVARAIHELSARSKGPWVAVNCGAIPEALLESELFGHIKGAFTDASQDKMGLFQAADGGTLFLDEIAELPLNLQVKLLRVLEEREVRRVGDTRSVAVDVRVIAASLHKLSDRVEERLFRQDLFYRLNVINMELPPLRERREDIPELIEHFIARLNARQSMGVEGVTPQALELMMGYHWPGNVRELQNSIERGAVLAGGPWIGADVLPERLRREQDPVQQLFESEELSIKKMSAALEKILITRALQKTGGNRTRASELLELSHRALLYKIKDYDIDL